MVDPRNPSGTYAAILRKRQEADLNKQRAGRFQSVANAADPSGVVGGGAVAGMGMSQATPVAVDWGGIISKAAGNYMAARSEKKASEASNQADELNRMFMQESIGEDPEAQRLLQMAQAGVPGAEQALADRVAPKKEALGAFLQYIQTGNADPQMAAELAPRYGLSPEIGMQAATSYRQNMMDASERDFQQRQALNNQSFSQRVALKGIPQAKAGAAAPEAGAMPGPAPTGALGMMEGLPPAPDWNSLSYAEKQYGIKAIQEEEKNQSEIRGQMYKYEELRPMLEEAFGAKQKASEFLLNAADKLPGPLGSAAMMASDMLQNEANAKLKDYINGAVLKKMAALGGNDSNEELARMMATLPRIGQSPEVAIALTDALHRFETISERVMQIRKQALAAGGHRYLSSIEQNLYKVAEQQLLQAGAIGPRVDLSGGSKPAPMAQQQAPAPAPQQQAPAAAAPAQQAPAPVPQQQAPQVPPTLAPMAPAQAPITTPSGIKIRIKQ